MIRKQKSPFPCKRKCAVLQQLVTSSLGCVLHCYDNLTRENIRFLQEINTILHPKLISSTLVSAAATRSMAPPIPFTILPGIIQLARSPQRDTLYQFLDSEEIVKCPQTRKFLRTCIAPKMVRPTWPPLIMAKLSSLEKKELPGMAVTVCLPALIRSGSTFGLHD